MWHTHRQTHRCRNWYSDAWKKGVGLSGLITGEQVCQYLPTTISAKTSSLELKRVGFGKLPVTEHTLWKCASGVVLGKPNTVIFVLLVHSIKIPLCASHIIVVISVCITSQYDLVQQLLWHSLWRAGSWLIEQPRWSWLNYKSHLQLSMTTTTSGN